MIWDHTTKSVVAVAPLSVASNATQTGTAVDTFGWDVASFDIVHDSAAAVTNSWTTIQLSEASDSAAASNYTAIAAFTGGVAAGNFAIPDVSASLPTTVRFNVDKTKYERFLLLTLTPAGAASIVFANCRLGKYHTAGANTSAAALGAGVIVNA